MVDLIFNPAGLDITDEVLERGEEREVEAMTMRVMRPEDLLVTKLMAMTEHTLNYRSCLEIARALREQIDWEDVRGADVLLPLRPRLLRDRRGPRGAGLEARPPRAGRRPRGASTASRARSPRSAAPARA